MKHCVLILAGVLLPGLAGLVAGCSQGTGANGTSDLDKITSDRESNQLQEDLALATSTYIELLEKGSRTQMALDELRRLHTQWNTEVMALLQNEDGRFLAADEADVKVFRAHVESTNPVSESTISNFSTVLHALIAPIQTAVTEGTVAGMPNPELGTRLADLDVRVQESLAPYKSAVSAIQALVATAKRRGTRGTQTLQEEVDVLKSAEAAARAATIEAARLEAEEEVTQQLAKAEQDLVRAQGEKTRQELEFKAAAVRAAAAEQELRARAENPETLSRLAPFVSPGESLLVCSNARNFRWANLAWIKGQGDVLVEAPMSLTSINCTGALNPTADGLKVFFKLATDGENDRPDWGANSSSVDWDWVKANQTLLRELGNTLVNEGKLLP